MAVRMLIPSPELPGSGSEGISQSRYLSGHPLSSCKIRGLSIVTKLLFHVKTLVKKEMVTNETIKFAHEI